MYKDINDYELLYMVCDARENDFEILISKYRPLIYKVVKNYLRTFKKFGYELDDLMQIGYITLYKASTLYDVFDHSMFYTYFKTALTNTIIANIRMNTTSKKEVLNQAFSYDNIVPNTNISYIELFPSEESTKNMENELIVFKNSMPALLSYIFELFYSGYNKKEIIILLDEDLSIIKNGYIKIKEHALTYKSLFFA